MTLVVGNIEQDLSDVEEAAPPTVLLVDDEPTVLSALSRLLRPDGVTVLTASGGQEALATLEERDGNVSVVLSDYSMPGMTGAEFLRSVRLRWPDITRVMLTGNADLPAAARAVNEGHLSRLYTKPWQPDEIRRALAEAVEQHRLLGENRRLRALAEQQARRLEQWNQRLEALVAERTEELKEANTNLQRGLLDTVRLLLTFIERRLPERAARCREVARLGGQLAERLGMAADQVQRVQVASLVHDVGLMALPDYAVRQAPSKLPTDGRLRYEQHAAIGHHMLSAVGQLADIATWIRHHHERWDGQGYPDRLAGANIPLPSRIIAVADGYLDAVGREGGTAAEWRRAQRTAGALDPQVLACLDELVSRRTAAQPSEHEDTTVSVGDVRVGMVVVQPVHSVAGAVLVPANEVLTPKHVGRLNRLLADGVLATTTLTVRFSPPAGAT